VAKILDLYFRVEQFRDDSHDLTVTIGVGANGFQLNDVILPIGASHHFGFAQRQSEIGIEICWTIVEFDVEGRYRQHLGEFTDGEAFTTLFSVC
jgi:hypothetical protein